MKRLFLAAAVLLLAGCNTYYNGTYQKITVYTGGVENVDCKVETDKNRYRVLAPGELMVERTEMPLTFRCEKTHYLKTEKLVKSKIELSKKADYNALNGFLPGLAYDAMTDSIYAYPDSVMIAMTPDPKALRLPQQKVVTPKKRVPEVYKDDE